MFLDTSAFIEIFQSPEGSARFNKIVSSIGEEEVYISIVQLAEVADWGIRNKVSVLDRVALVKEMARVVPLNEQIYLNAATIKSQRRNAGHNDFALIEGIILASARSMNQRLLTFDKDFAGEADCVVIS